MKLSILSYSLIPKEHGKSDLKNNSLIKRGILATDQELFMPPPIRRIADGH